MAFLSFLFSMQYKKNPRLLPGNLYYSTGGDKGIRTPDLLHAKQALSQLSYTPDKTENVNKT